jgi:hypothetical protein
LLLPSGKRSLRTSAFERHAAGRGDTNIVDVR